MVDNYCLGKEKQLPPTFQKVKEFLAEAKLASLAKKLNPLKK